MFNTPLAQGIRLRVTGFYQNLDEQVDNLYGDDAYGLRAYGVRAKLAFDLAENATFTLAGTYTKNNSSQNVFITETPGFLAGFAAAERSEEHTSELQSLMRISYAVFCLKKKKGNDRQ